MESLRPHQKVVKTKCGQWNPMAQKQHVRLSNISIHAYTLWERNQESKFNFIEKHWSIKSYKIPKKRTECSWRIWFSGENMFSMCKVLLSIHKTKIIFEQNNWKDIPCSWIRKINIIKMIISLLSVLKLKCLFTKNIKILWNSKKIQMIKVILKKKKEAGGITWLESRVNHKAIVI